LNRFSFRFSFESILQNKLLRLTKFNGYFSSKLFRWSK